MTTRAHSDTVAVVTGGTRGVGKAIAGALSDAGYAVAAVGRSSPRFSADVSDPADVARLRETVVRQLGQPLVLVNAAGVHGRLSPIATSDPDDWIRTLMIDTVGAYLTCRAFVPGMIEHGWGRVVNVSSAASLLPPGTLWSAYGTAKAALNQLTRHLAAELEHTGVTANVIHPGDVKTDMWAELEAQVRELGPVAAEYAGWVDWVDETGGDPAEKAAALVLDVVRSDVNGRFLWIHAPLRPPVPSWDDPDGSARSADD